MRKLIALLILAASLTSARADPISSALVPPLLAGTGSPEGVVVGTVGTIYRRTDGGAATTLYLKESGSSNTGWVAYGSPSGTGAPTTATYITQTANGSLSAEQALSTLATGLAVIANGTGVITTQTVADLEADIEAVVDLSDLQGAVIDAQVPDTITLTYLNYETGFEGVIDLQDLQGAVTDAQVPDSITVTLAGTATALANARTIGGVSFNGTADIVPQTIAVTDTILATTYPALFESATGNLQPHTDGGFTYDATTGIISSKMIFLDTDAIYTATTLGEAIEELADVDGNGPNSSTSKVDWTQIKNMPSGFADGSDDGTGGGGGGTDDDAIHDNVSGEIATITDKTVPVAADHLLLEDSQSSNAKKDSTVGSLETALEGVMDLQDMQGAVTDAQVPDSITVSAAGSGDSATAFFTIGQIERARGGTGVDSSAYGSGIFGSNAANVTIDVDTMSELETAISATNIIEAGEIDTLAEFNALVGDGNFVSTATSITIQGTSGEIATDSTIQDLTSNRSWTLSIPANFDLGGKTSFEIPNSTVPTVDLFGELAADSNLWGSNRGAPVFYDGTAPVALLGALVSDTPLDGQVPVIHMSGGSTGTITWETFSATPGGSDTQLQYNDSGVLNGATGITYNDGTGVMGVTEMSTATLNVDSFRILDNVDQSHALIVEVNEDLVSDINLRLDMNGSTRNLTMAGDATISGTNSGDQTITLTGMVTGTGTGSFATTIAADSVTYAMIQNVTDARILGRSAGSNGDAQEITIGAGLTLSGGALTASAGGTTWTDIGDATGDTGIALGAFETDFTSTIDASGEAIWTLTNTDADTAADSAFIDLRHNDGGDSNVFYARFIGDNDGTPVNDYLFSQTAFTIGSGVTTSFGGPVSLGASATATTATANDSDTSVASTAYVQAELTAYQTDTLTLSNKNMTSGTTSFSSPSVDDTAYGDLITGQNNTGGTTQWDAVYLNSSSQWVLADANGTNTYPCRGLAIATVSTGAATSVIISGIIRNDAWAWTPGGTIYLSQTAGGLTQTQPNISGDKIQVIGYALTADVMVVKVSPDYGTIP